MGGESASELDAAIRSVLELGSAAVGEDFFPAMVRQLAETLKADITLIGVLREPDRKSVDTVALCVDGEVIDNIDYELEGTPCSEVVGMGVCHFASDVAEQFPDDAMLADMGVEGYVGVPLHGSGPEPLGIMVALYREPVEDEQLASAVMLVFAARTAAEVERLSRERERRDMERQLLHAQKLESLGVLAGGIAHDFNNLLCGVLGSADLASASIGSNHPASADLDMIRETAQRAAELCRQLLAYSGKGRFEVLPLDLSVLLREMGQLLDVSAAKTVTVRLDVASGLPAIEADATQLRQIILNLVINGSEAIGDEPGTITITTGSMDCDRAYLSATHAGDELPEGRYVYVEVADTGAGMAEETRTRIFDPFFSTKFTGRGLGLAATLGIVRGHGGSIHVHSELDRGTTFKILFPASSLTPSDQLKATGQVPEWQGHGLALFVEDDELVQSVGRRMLERLGFEVLTASDGVEGVEVFRERAAEVRLVLLDLTMPRMSGEDAFRELRRIRSDVKVILTSGYNEQDTTRRFVGKGLAGFIQKPFELSTLSNRIRAALGESD